MHGQGLIRAIVVVAVAAIGGVGAISAAAQPVPSPALSHEASLDNNANNEWEDQTGVADFDWQTGPDVPRNNVAGSTSTAITHAYDFDGSHTASLGASYRDLGLFGSGTDAGQEPATLEIWFRPDELAGQQLLMEAGGGAGTSFSLNGSTLQFASQRSPDDQGDDNSIGLTADLDDYDSDDFVQAVGVMDMDNDDAQLYVNSALEGSAGGLTGQYWTGSDPAAIAGAAGRIGANDGPFGDLSGYSQFAGGIAITRYYPAALSDEQVAATYDTVIPEPTAIALLGLGGLTLLGRRRRTTA